MLTWYAKGPAFRVITWQGYDINRYTFYMRAEDMKSTFQNSGVCIEAYDLDGKQSWYYGVIEDIWEMDYVFFNKKIIPVSLGQPPINEGRQVWPHNSRPLEFRFQR